MSNSVQDFKLLIMFSQIYDTSGYGKLSVDDFCTVLMHTLAMQKYEAYEIFQQVDSTGLGYITFGT